MSTEPNELESRIRAACEAGDRDRAVTVLLDGYGPELLAFLYSRTRSGADAEDVFAIASEKLWNGLPAFEWRCSARAWAYRVARHAAADYRELAANQPRRNLALSQHVPLSRLVAQARTTTAAFQRTAQKDRARALRQELEPDDQLLLVLRVDRGMEFLDIAAALGADDATPAPDELRREAARLRKRFERVKERLRQLAREHGLI